MSDLSDFKSFIGNPVVSGTVTGTNIVLTRADASTVTIDAERLVNGTEATIGLPNWYQTYASPGGGSSTAGAQLGTNTPPNTTNPFYFGTTLKKGREFAFSHSTGSQTIWYGIWGGAVTYTPADAGKSAYWSKHLRINTTEVDNGTTDFDSVGFDLTTDYDITHGTTQCVLQYDYATNKLKLWDVTGGWWHLIATGAIAQDGNPVIISCAVNSGGAVPTFTDREQDWNIIAQAVAGADTTWRDGLLQHSVIKHNRGLHPGEKMVCTTPQHWAAQYLGFDYTGASIGQTSVQVENSGAIQVISSESLSEYTSSDGWTINTTAERYLSGDNTDIDLDYAKLSFRYHTNNSMDLFDEDNEEVLFTKDVNLDGNPAYLHIYFSTTVNPEQVFSNWTFEPFAPTWYYWAGNYNLKANQKFDAANLTGISTRLSWAEKLYPGQELYWTNTAAYNISIGIRNSTDTAYITSVRITNTKFNETGGIGTDIATRHASGYNHSNKKAVMRYNFTNNKLQWLDVHTAGVETLIAEALVAEDGNPVIVTCDGANATPPVMEHRYYGWEYVHTSTSKPQPWRNWRINRPAVNDGIKLDTVLQHRQALIPGRYFQWNTTANEALHFNGGWKSSNAATGLSNVEAQSNFTTYWDWGWYTGNLETIWYLHGMTHNVSNSNYNAGAGGFWDDPNPGTTLVRLRYHSNNTVDIYDQSNSEVIANKTVNLDGSPFYLAWGIGATITDIAKFHGGGDLTTGAL